MKISIITATYNSGKTVRDTFDSILRQDYKNYECVVVDGGSTDDTLDILREYERKFDKLRAESLEKEGPSFCWVSEPDKGIYDAMNKGISRASGDVVGILNSDDYYTSFDILSAVARRFEKCPEIDAVYGDIHYVNVEDTTNIVRYYSSKHFSRKWMRLGFMPAHPSFYCRKSTYSKYALSPEQLLENRKRYTDNNVDLSVYHNSFFFNPTYPIAADFENLLRMIFVGRIKTSYIYRDFVTMRTGGASSSGTASHKQINRDHFRAFKEHKIYSNCFLISFRYFYKLFELLIPRLRRPKNVE